MDTPVAVDKGAVSVQALEMAVVELILEEAAVRRGSTAADDAPARRVAADEYLFWRASKRRAKMLRCR